jgi:hypothetical protein
VAEAVYLGREDAPVFFIGDLRIPFSRYHPRTYDQGEDHQKKQRIQERRLSLL